MGHGASDFPMSLYRLQQPDKHFHFWPLPTNRISESSEMAAAIVASSPDGPSW